MNVSKDANKAASTFFLLLMLFLALVWVSGNVGAVPLAGDIRILPDGSVEGTDKIHRNGDVYTLVGDISGSVGNGQNFITLEKDNIIFDGGGRTIQGNGTGVAFSVWGRSGITIKNTRIIDFGTGIEIRFTDFELNSTASDNRILSNYIKTAYFGMNLNTANSIVSDNTFVSTNANYGVLFASNNTSFSGNKFVKGGLILDEHSTQNSFSGNTVDGKPLVYLDGVSNQVVDGAGQVFLSDCSNIVIKNVEPPADFRVTIHLLRTSNSQITNCRGNIVLKNSHGNTISNCQLTETGSMITGPQRAAVELSASNNNTIVGNVITSVSSYGVNLYGSAYNDVYRNIISSTGSDGVRVESTSIANSVFNHVHENNVANCATGISLHIARNNAVYGNIITNCESAITLYSAHENAISGNNLTGSTKQGVYLSCSDNNSFHHNNFAGNKLQAFEKHEVYWWAIENSTYQSENNTWDDGKEGNFWSDYTGRDGNGDGIGDTPYTVYENFTDRYPLMTPAAISSVQVDLPEYVPSEPTSQEELRIELLSPENTTYNTRDVPLVFTLSEPVSWMGYSLDSQTNVATSGNITLTGLTEGSHSLTVSANTTNGVTVSSETVYFTISLEEQGLPSSTLLTVTVASASAIAVFGAGLFIYFFKRKR